MRKSSQMFLVLLVLLAGISTWQYWVKQRVIPEQEIQAAIEHYRKQGIPTPYASELRKTFFSERLNLPTMTTRIGNEWFIVDSYNNRVIYSQEVTQPIEQWSVLDNQLSRPHSIASDGHFYVVDDTDAHAVRVYLKTPTGFKKHQAITDIGARPHRVMFDQYSKKFFVLASSTQEMVELVRKDDRLIMSRKVPLQSIQGIYTRSFRFIGDHIWLFTSAGVVSVIDYRNGSYQEVNRYSLPESLSNLNDFIIVGDRVYVTATLGKLVSCPFSHVAAEGGQIAGCSSLAGRIGYIGNPYYFSIVNGQLILSVVAGQDAVLSLTLREDGGVMDWSYLIPPHQKSKPQVTN